MNGCILAYIIIVITIIVAASFQKIVGVAIAL
jgi:hypothetical protein